MPAAQKIITETVKHHEAFEFYYWLGDKRDLSQVARQFKVTPTAAAKWSQSFHWADRVKERDEKVIQRIRESNDAEAIAIKDRQLKIMRATQSRYAARLLKTESERASHGVTQYEPTAIDAARAAQHELLLTGQATGRTEITVGQSTVEGLVAAVITILKRKLPDCCPACKTVLGLQSDIAQELLKLSQHTNGNTDTPSVQTEAHGVTA